MSVFEAESAAPAWRIKRLEQMPALRLRSRRPSPPASLHDSSDAELLALADAGSPDAFEIVYDRHCTVALALAHRICGERAAAEDVTQEAFLALWRARERYDPSRGEVRSWLLQIVRNSALDRLRRTAVHERRRASSDGIEELLEARERTDDEVLERAQAGEVRDALEKLPGEQRQVIELSYFDGLTHTEIATRLGQPVGTIKSRMRLGLLKLRAQLSGTQDAPAGGRGLIE
jgi:RNA polymerase sigma-70 factor, ECF subfamily